MRGMGAVPEGAGTLSVTHSNFNVGWLGLRPCPRPWVRATRRTRARACPRAEGRERGAGGAQPQRRAGALGRDGGGVRFAMLLRIRTRDGLERVTIDDGATVGGLRAALEEALEIPAAQQTLSLDQKVLLAGADLGAFTDMARDAATLASVGVRHGSIVCCAHDVERTVAQTVKPNQFRKMTMDDLYASQTRIENQETPACATLSMDSHAANAFQSYLHQTAFHAKRMGYMYGTVDEAGNVRCEAIFEPPQEGNHVVVAGIEAEEARELERADALASSLGLRRVGLVFSCVLHEDAPEFTVSAAEMRLMCAAAAAACADDTFVTAIVRPELTEDGRAEVHFEAFQASKQAVEIYKRGWFAEAEAYEGVDEIREEDGEGADISEVLDVGNTRMTNDVILAGKDTRDVDNDFFLVPVKILNHEGPLRSTFPAENRMIPQTVNDLREHLQDGKSKGLPYVQRLSDFHLLLFLAKHMDSGDMALLAEAVRQQTPVQDGYQLIIDALAGLV